MSRFHSGWRLASFAAQKRTTTLRSTIPLAGHSSFYTPPTTPLAHVTTRSISTILHTPISFSLPSTPSSRHHHHHHSFTTLSPAKASSSSSSSDPETSESTLNYKALHTPLSVASSHFDLSKIPDAQERTRILNDFIIFPDYLSPKEHDMLMQAATKKLKRALGKEVRYEDGHFDGVITRYRECSASDWCPPGTIQESESMNSSSTSRLCPPFVKGQERTTASEVMQSIKAEFFPHHWHWVAPHLLELEAARGGIKPHVDHLDASGEVVAGLCLGSTAVMELIHEEDPERQFRVLLPKGAFYFQRGHVRYHYKHGIPIPEEDHRFRDTVIPKEKRISVMLRNALKPGFAARSTSMGSMGQGM